MAAAGLARLHDGVATGEGDGDQLGTKQRHQPTHGPGKAAFSNAPTHKATALEGCNPLGNGLRQELTGWASGFEDFRKDKRSLGGVTHLKGSGINPAALGKTNGGLGRDTVFERLCCGWPLALIAQIGG